MAALAQHADAVAAVAHDLLLEKYSPVKPYEYQWEVRWSVGPGDVFVALRGPNGEYAGNHFPRLLDDEDAWGRSVHALFRSLESEPIRILANTYRLWREAAFVACWSRRGRGEAQLLWRMGDRDAEYLRCQEEDCDEPSLWNVSCLCAEHDEASRG